MSNVIHIVLGCRGTGSLSQLTGSCYGVAQPVDGVVLRVAQPGDRIVLRGRSASWQGRAIESLSRLKRSCSWSLRQLTGSWSVSQLTGSWSGSLSELTGSGLQTFIWINGCGIIYWLIRFIGIQSNMNACWIRSSIIVLIDLAKTFYKKCMCCSRSCLFT